MVTQTLSIELTLTIEKTNRKSYKVVDSTGKTHFENKNKTKAQGVLEYLKFNNLINTL